MKNVKIKSLTFALVFVIFAAAFAADPENLYTHEPQIAITHTVKQPNT